MKRKILVALLVFALNAFAACSGGTHTCTASGLTAGQVYAYSYVDSAGTEYSGYLPSRGTNSRDSKRTQFNRVL